MRRRIYRWAIVGLLWVSALLTSGVGPPTLIESDSATTPVTSRTLTLMKNDRPPPVVATAAVVMDATTGQVIYEKKAHERRAQASTTKIMTALVTLENARLDAVVRASANVRVEPTIIGLDPGDELTVEQLLYGLLLPSGNDAALALAEYIGGSIPRFAEMMNARAAQLGLKDTRFVNPHGLDEDGHYSSAYDLAVITRAAFQNPVFERIVATQEHRVTTPIRWLFRNNNRLLSTYTGADGVKTGYTDNAGRCLVFSATRKGHRAISVVLDSSLMYEDSADLLDFFFANYDWLTLRVADSPLSEYSSGGETRRTAPKTEPEILVPIWQKPYVRWFFSVPASSPGDGGASGVLTYYLFGKKAAEVGLFDQAN